jgi:hypothetical protein
LDAIKGKLAKVQAENDNLTLRVTQAKQAMKIIENLQQKYNELN